MGRERRCTGSLCCWDARSEMNSVLCAHPACTPKRSMKAASTATISLGVNVLPVHHETLKYYQSTNKLHSKVLQNFTVLKHCQQSISRSIASSSSAVHPSHMTCSTAGCSLAHEKAHQAAQTLP